VLLAGPADADDADFEGGGLLHLVIAHGFFLFSFRIGVLEVVCGDGLSVTL
jgi:hypothetical protein